MARPVLTRTAVLVALALAATALAAEAPVTVSPGNPAKLALVADRCPTFSWAGGAEAKGYELMVYRVGEQGAETEPLLRRSLPAPAFTWTPDLTSCLERGWRYAWTVRAVVEKGSSEWSEPSLFEVASAPTASEFEAAIEVVRAYLEDRGGTPQTAPRTVSSSSAPPASAKSGPRRPPAPSGPILFSGEPALRVDAGEAQLIGVLGTTDIGPGEGEDAIGVYGEQTNPAAQNAWGVAGVAQSVHGVGVLGLNRDTGTDHSGLHHGAGIWGLSDHPEDGIGVLGSAQIGVLGVGQWGGFFQSNQAGAGNLLGGGSLGFPVFVVDHAGNVEATSFGGVVISGGAIDMSAFTVDKATGSFSATCPGGSLRTGGGCNCGAENIIVSAPNGSSAWSCQCSNSGTPSAFALCLSSP